MPYSQPCPTCKELSDLGMLYEWIEHRRVAHGAKLASTAMEPQHKVTARRIIKPTAPLGPVLVPEVHR